MSFLLNRAVCRQQPLVKPVADPRAVAAPVARSAVPVQPRDAVRLQRSFQSRLEVL